MHNKVLGGNYMMRSTTFLMQNAWPPQKDLINCELVSSLGMESHRFNFHRNSKKKKHVLSKGIEMSFEF